MSRRILAIAAAVCATVSLAACSPAAPQAAPTPAARAEEPAVPSPERTLDHGAWEDGDVRQPLPFEVRYGDEALLVHATTFCGAGSNAGCVDGFDPNPPSIGSPAEIFVHVPVEGLDELFVSLSSDRDSCLARTIDTAPHPLGDGWWRIEPLGPAGEYAVSLSARGPSGDMIADLLWTTPADLPLPEPEAVVSLISDHDGRPDSYGLDLVVTNLPETPDEAAATVTATAVNGASYTIEAGRDVECAGEGTVRFTVPEKEAKAAAAIGDLPFTTEVTLRLDGAVHAASAVYPDDRIPDDDPYLALDFSPALPAGSE